MGGTMLWEKIHSVRDACSVGGGIDAFVTAVVAEGWCDVPTGDAVGGPRASVGGFSWMTTLVPGGAKGVALKSNCPNSWACADKLGLDLDRRSKFRDRTPWSMMRSQRCMGKSLSVVLSPAIM